MPSSPVRSHHLHIPRKTDMSLNSFITLGRSGLRVSPLCLGSMTFGEDLGWGASVADSETMIAAYLERGGNFIDTANVYTNGHSEKIIGDFFAKKGNRDRVVIGTNSVAACSRAIRTAAERAARH